MSTKSPYVNAIRILYILLHGSTKIPKASSGSPVRKFRGEAKLHALDFWVRNPDYLSEELLNKYEKTKNKIFLESARNIFESGEPDIRKIPMIRYKFGAFEAIDDTLSILRSRDLVRITGIKTNGVTKETDFLLMPSALKLANEIKTEFPVIKWYDDRASLVATLAGNRGGAALKAIQYKQLEYANTKLGQNIPSITERVKARLNKLTEGMPNEKQKRQAQ